MASSASLIVTPFRFRAVTSSPNGKCRSIFLTGGVVRCFFSQLFSGSSSELGDLLSRLQGHHQHRTGQSNMEGWEDGSSVKMKDDGSGAG